VHLQVVQMNFVQLTPSLIMVLPKSFKKEYCNLHKKYPFLSYSCREIILLKIIITCNFQQIIPLQNFFPLTSPQIVNRHIAENDI
jgi:hypothetical protein